MGCRWSLAAFLIFLVAASAPAVPLRQAGWTSAGTMVEVLTSDPVACVVVPATRRERDLVLIGEVAFRAPLLLGGQAARVGLSCNACHRNGRGNPHFSFPGLSGAAGTADITSSLMSSHRGDGQFNPKPIPDLATSPPRVSRDPATPALREFIRGLVVEEFDGPVPPPRVVEGLAAYVRAIKPDHCAANAVTPASVRYDLNEAMRAVDAASVAHQAGEWATARLMLSSARSTLGLIAERYAGQGVENRIVQLDNSLKAAQQKIDARRDPAHVIDRSRRQVRRIAPTLFAREKASLYNASRLRTALGP